jgi:hypothetical protein
LLKAQGYRKMENIDDQTGEAKSIIEIYEKGGKVYGKVVDILALLVKKDVCQNCVEKIKIKQSWVWC